MQTCHKERILKTLGEVCVSHVSNRKQKPLEIFPAEKKFKRGYQMLSKYLKWLKKWETWSHKTTFALKIILCSQDPSFALLGTLLLTSQVSHIHEGGDNDRMWNLGITNIHTPRRPLIHQPHYRKVASVPTSTFQNSCSCS